MDPKNEKTGIQKWMQKSMPKKRQKLCQKASKMTAKWLTNRRDFGTWRFVVFDEGYNVKIVFLHDQGYQESIKNQSKINANSMLEKGMQKT